MIEKRPSINPGLSTVQQVFDWLHDMILRGKLLPGARLSESEIAGQVGVSRQPVREAFIRLAGQGLAEIRPQRGTFIGRISVREVLAVRTIREGVESDIVRKVASAPPADFEDRMRAQIARQRQIVAEGDMGGFIELDNLFHRSFAIAAEQEDVWKRIEQLTAQMNRLRHLSVQVFDPAGLVDQHEAILDAVLQGDAQQAEAAIRHHLRRVLDDLPQTITTRPELFTD